MTAVEGRRVHGFQSGRAVSAEVARRLADFLVDGARLLDDRRWAEWVKTCAQDIDYTVHTRANLNLMREGDTADDVLPYVKCDYRGLELRVQMLTEDWHAIDPPPWTLHAISNVRCWVSERASSADDQRYRVEALCIVHRNRVGEDLVIVPCRYEDEIAVEADGTMKLVSRQVIVEAERIDGALAYLL